jgi:tRNA pseudouridine55 synthase
MDSVLNIEKPSGPSSFSVVARVRGLLHIRRAGHAGTLDPLASGVLLVMTGQATRAAQYLEALPKEYLATVLLGRTTDSDDLEGATMAEAQVPDIDRTAMESILEHFTGSIQQAPPRFSALKRNGMPLYRLARGGTPVDPEPRTVTIHSIELLDLRLPEAVIKVRCAKGTYIRSLARDIGKQLGCGGTLATLQRTAVGDFTVRDAIPLHGMDETLLREKAMTLDSALNFLPAIDLDEGLGGKVRQGNRVQTSSETPAGAACRLRVREQLLAIGRALAGGWIQPECVFN